MAEKTQRRACEILRMAQAARISAGKDPMGLAASALYVACTLEGEQKTQKDVAEAARVTEVTIRNRYKSLRQALQI
jgi:transcription initiation factor TFIIB